MEYAKMHFKNDGDITQADLLEAIAADKFAQEMDDILLDIADLNPEICPPDRRYYRDDREAWVYEHGNIIELVFIKTTE